MSNPIKTIGFSLLGLGLYFLVLKPLVINVQNGIRVADECERLGTGAIVQVKENAWMKCH